MRTLQILGVGCPKCDRLFQNAKQAAAETGVPCEIVKVTDIVEMLSFNAIGLPALAVDGDVRIAGRVPTTEEIKPLITSTKEGKT